MSKDIDAKTSEEFVAELVKRIEEYRAILPDLVAAGKDSCVDGISITLVRDTDDPCVMIVWPDESFTSTSI